MFKKSNNKLINELYKEIDVLNLSLSKQQKEIHRLNFKLSQLNDNQDIIRHLITKLAQCHQLKWDGGRYVSVRGNRVGG
jgi:hypothetical protein